MKMLLMIFPKRIAACAMAYNLTIVTVDKHFSFIKGLSLENR